MNKTHSVSIMCEGSFKIRPETPVASRYLIDETKLKCVGISQHFFLGHCNIIVPE